MIRLCLTTLLALAHLTSAHALELHIEDGDASQTLAQFARQSGLHLSYDASTLRGVHTHSIHGEFSWSAALGAMLQEVDWVAQEVEGSAIRLTRLANPHPIARDWVEDEADANGVIDCAPLRFTLTLLGYQQVREDGREICLVVGQMAQEAAL